MIRVGIDRRSLPLQPGQPAEMRVAVVNDDPVERRVRLRFIGIDATWVEGLEDEVVVGPNGGREERTITITLPNGFPPGEQLVGIEVSGASPTPFVPTSVELVVESLDSLSMTLSPSSFRGAWRGRTKLNLVNRGNDPVTVSFEGKSPDESGKEGLTFGFDPQKVTLQPGERVRPKVNVRGRRPTVGQPRVRPLTIEARGHSAPVYAVGRFTQRPLLTKQVIRTLALFVIVATWAGGLVSAVRMNEDRREENVAEARAQREEEEQQAEEEAEAGGEDGADGEDGEGGEDGAEGEEAEAPVGATISGKVDGLRDRSDVRVQLRPVSLDAVDDGADLEAAALPPSGGKRSSQQVETPPAGPIGDAQETVTDDEGSWAFAGLASPANYELTFSKEGFGVRSYVVTVDDESPAVELEVAMEAGDGAISGTIRDEGGDPMGGVEVVITDGEVTHTTTTPTAGSNIGTFSVGGLGTPGTYLVTAARRGFGTETTSVELGGSDSASDVDLTLVAGVGSITGRVTGPDGGVGGITVTAASEEVERSVTTLTDDPVGEFNLPQLPIPGSYTLTVTGDGFIPQTRLVELTEAVADVDFELVGTTGSISGTVTEAGGGALPAVGVTVSQDEPLVKTLTAVSPAGTYEISGLLPGTYVVSFERFGYAPTSRIIELVAGQRARADAEMVELTSSELDGSAIVRGIVRSTATGDPIDDAEVTYSNNDDDDESASSNDEGSFLLEDVPPGTTDLLLEADGYEPAIRTIQVVDGEDITVDIQMIPLGGVQGQVTDLVSAPLAGVTVSVTAADGTAVLGTDTTDAEGQFLIPQILPTGSYTATFELTGFGERSRDFDATIGAVTTLDTTLVELGVIDGAVQEPASSGGFVPVANVTVTIESGTYDGTTFTPTATVFGPVVDLDGRFTMTGLQPGDYRITASRTVADGPDVGDEDDVITSSKVIADLDLREIRDGGIVLVPGTSVVQGQVFYLRS
ncbi:MAG TPA: carboxypeptidase-like regulatory domain-containing protein, partial [Acidimicrobiales bacterium]|nr:carboxypeptidase-like regulatory domain-containing protein [Acidimicrobiales bacterium]